MTAGPNGYRRRTWIPARHELNDYHHPENYLVDDDLDSDEGES